MGESKKYVYNKCIDCGSSISYYAKRCRTCMGKTKLIYKDKRVRIDGTKSIDKDYLSKKAWRESNKSIDGNSKKKWAKNNHIKRKAQWLAIHIPLKDKCEHCGIGKDLERLERHHPDYTKPLYVITLCKCCHAGEHSGGR